MRTETDDTMRRWEDGLRRLVGMERDDPDRDRLRTEVIEGLLPLAERLAHRYSGRGERLEDLIQVARLGLIKAIDGFDPTLGGFVGYAVPTIQGELKRYFRDQCWDLRVPRRLQELRLAVRSTSERLAQSVGHEPTAAEIAAELHVEREQVWEAMDAGAAYSTASLDVEVFGDGDGGAAVADLVGGPDRAVEAVPDRVSLRPALSRLPERERAVLAMRFVDNMTQSQIAERIGLSQMHVSRLLRRTLDGLRAWIDGESTQVDVCRSRNRRAA